MKEFKYVITDAEGIHARPAGELVKLRNLAVRLQLLRMASQETARKSSVLWHLQ